MQDQCSVVLKMKTVCQMGEDCRQYFVIEFNGDVYPCDFFVEPGLKLGNIFSASWRQLDQSQMYKTFGKEKSKWHPQCEVCKHLAYCAGDCVRHRFYEGHYPDKLSWLCKGLKRFYDHAIPDFIRLAEQLKGQDLHR